MAGDLEAAGIELQLDDAVRGFIKGLLGQRERTDAPRQVETPHTLLHLETWRGCTLAPASSMSYGMARTSYRACWDATGSTRRPERKSGAARTPRQLRSTGCTWSMPFDNRVHDSQIATLRFSTRTSSLTPRW